MLHAEEPDRFGRLIRGGIGIEDVSERLVQVVFALLRHRQERVCPGRRCSGCGRRGGSEV
jgi:hypothetical protein